MNGEETEFIQGPDGQWTAKEVDLEATGRTQDEAASALLKLKAEKTNPVVGEQTLVNKQELKSQFDVTVSRVQVTELKTKQKNGLQFVAFREDNPGFQGLGVNANAAKLDLFKREKERDQPASKI